MSRPEPTTQYEALRRLGAPALPEGYAYRVHERDYDEDRQVQIVTMRRERIGREVGPGYSSTEWDRVVASMYVKRLWRWVIPIGDRAHIRWACRWLAWNLKLTIRAVEREDRRLQGLRTNGPLR